MSALKSNPHQEKAIGHTVGAAQVFAGPGSGKTFVTVQRIQSLITHCGIEPSHILVITFTKAAAGEMQERFFNLTKPVRPPVWFGTFHAVFYHILKQSPQYRGYSILTESEKKKLFRQLIHMYKRFAGLQEEDLEELISIISVHKISSLLKPMSVQKISTEDICFLEKEYCAYLQEFKQMDFDDILIHCHRLLSENPETLAFWQAQFRYILIDEFQDISPKQYAIMKLLAMPENNLFIVGDDDQSIYGFRGANPDSMQQFMRDYPSAERIFLEVNYRCGSQIVSAASRVIAENRNRVEKRILAAHEQGRGFFLELCESEAAQEEYVLQKLHEKHGENRLHHCAMICRTNFDCAMWAQRLRAKGIPFVMKETPQNPYGHFVIRDIMAYLALAQGALLPKYFLRVMNRPVRYFKRDCVPQAGVTKEALLAYYADAPILQERVERLFYDLNSMKSKRPHLQVHYVRKVIGYDRYLQEKYGTDKAAELTGKAEAFQKLAEGFQCFQTLNDYVSQFEADNCVKNPGTGKQEPVRQGNRVSGPQESFEREEAGRQSEEEKKRLENSLQLMTMHASKGLEFDTVFVPDCQEGKIPSNKSKTDEEIEEERRMFYVAMTRAKRELYLSAYYGKSGKDMPSRFLDCLCQSSSPTSSSNSALSRYSSKASATASYSLSSSI